jgi:hypothetical protein
MIYYLVTPKCTDPNRNTLYLTAQQSTRTVAVASLLPNNDPSQLWTPVEYLPGGNDQGFVLLNLQTDMVIAAPTDDAPVQLISVGAVAGSRATWAFKGEGEGYGALQLQQDTDMNLNVKGGGPYPSGIGVLAWSWSGGDPNEVWTFQLVAANA